jgi:hypothetical protein
MYRRFKTKNTDGTINVKWTVFGLGFSIDLKVAQCGRPIVAVVRLDLICIRFWWDIYKHVK